MKLFVPSCHIGTILDVGICPAMRCGRSAKHTVIGLTPRRVMVPFSKLTSLAFCTKRNCAFTGWLFVVLAACPEDSLPGDDATPLSDDFSQPASMVEIAIPANTMRIKCNLFMSLNRWVVLGFEF